MLQPLRKMKYRPILNDAGKPILLSEAEKYHAELLQRQMNELHYHRIKNSLGYEISITTLTSIAKRVSEQQFYQVPFADYVSLSVGEGTWSTNIEHFRSYDLGGDFSTGVINTGGGNDRLAMADAGIDGLNIKIYPWAKGISYSIFEMEYAAKSGNWSIIEAKNRALKKGFDLGLQYVAFLGLPGQNGANGNCLGLLNQPSINVNTTVITQSISSMSPSQFKTFAQTALEAYRANAQRTAMPNRFQVPESDYNGMASQSSPDFPIKSVLQILEETFKTMCGDDFKILPVAYADNSVSGLGYQNYTLYRLDPDSGIMHLPLPFTNTLANSINNFQFSSVAYAQFSGFLVIRPLEFLYFRY